MDDLRRVTISDADAAHVAHYQKNPVGFVHDVLGEDITVEDVLEGRAPMGSANAPTPQQKQLMEAVRDHDRVHARSGHNLGKTHIEARVGIWFLYCFAPSVVITTAPKAVQVKDLLWGRWRSAWHGARVELGGECLTTVCRPDPANPNWFAAGYTAKDPEGFQGYHELSILFILDEAPGVPRFIRDAIEGGLSGANAKILCVGNPTTKSGPFYADFRDPAFHKLQLSCWEHPNVIHQKQIYGAAIRPDWPQERLDAWGAKHPFYLGRVEGEFPETSENVLIPLDWIEAAVGREVSPGGGSAIGCDVARGGTNDTVMIKKQGGSFSLLKSYNGNDTFITSGHLRGLAPTVDAIGVDDVGVGGGVTDNLRHSDVRNKVYAFNAGQKKMETYKAGKKVSVPAFPDDDQFEDLAAWCWWQIRLLFEATYKAVNAGEDDPGVGISLEVSGDDLERLKEELSTREYSIHPQTGKIRVEKKEDYIARMVKAGIFTSGESPDYADAFVIAYWAHIKIKARKAVTEQDSRPTTTPMVTASIRTMDF